MEEEIYEIEKVLYQVEAIRNETVGLENSIINVFNRIGVNFIVDGDIPKSSELDSIIEQADQTISTYDDYIIPSLIDRINSY